MAAEFSAGLPGTPRIETRVFAICRSPLMSGLYGGPDNSVHRRRDVTPADVPWKTPVFHRTGTLTDE